MTIEATEGQTLTSPIEFSDSFQLTDKEGVVHNFRLSGTLEQKTEILTTGRKFIKEAKGKGWTSQGHSSAAARTQAVAAPADPNSTTEIIMGEQLIVSADEKGIHFRIKGGRYKQHGVPVYEEYLEALGIDPELKPGQAYPFKKRVVVQVNQNGDKRNTKAIALA